MWHDVRAYNTSAAAPMTTTITPVIPPTSTLPAPLADLAFAVELLAAAVLEAVEELAAAVLGVTALTSVGMRVPQVMHWSEPGLAMRHC